MRIPSWEFFLLTICVCGALRFSVAGREAKRILKDKKCDDGAVEYLTGNKVNVTVIPYDEHCLKKYIAQGHNIDLPNTVAVHMTGLPKTGTTWTEVFVGKLIEAACNSGLYPGCKFDLTYRGAMATIPSPGARRSGKVIRWNTFLKHDPPYDWTCQGFKQTRASDTTGCHLYKFQDTERKPPDWERCIFRTPYERIRECIPEYMQVQRELPVMDKIADELNEQKKTRVDMSGAQRKYIHVVRDPRDSTLSWVHYHGVNDPAEVDQSVRDKCNHFIAWTAFFYHWQMAGYGAVYPSMELFYRRLMDQAPVEYERVLRWLGLRMSAATLKQVVKETDFGAMKRMEKERALPGRNHPGKADAKVRKGGYDTFKGELSNETIQLCTEAMKVMLPERLLRAFQVIDDAEPWKGPAPRNPLLTNSADQDAF
mmetsp:Transcript_12302/g.29219  ORF Transcript_12302/g.29219 Transcript_12302/m.29219 type:complete len:425 (-) Transcript_12302:87-1361(-)